MGVLRSIAFFLGKFVTGYKVDQTDWADVFASLAHKTEDKHKMGGGLKEHEVDRPYEAREACLKDGKIKLSRFNQTGAFNVDNWIDYNGTIDDLGIPAWSPSEELEAGVQRTHKLSIYESVGPIEGTDTEIEPGVTTDWESFWVLVVATEGGLVPVLVSGFVKFDRVYEYTGDLAEKGLYRSVAFSGGYDGGYKIDLAEFADDLAAGKWVLVAQKSALKTFDVTFEDAEAIRGIPGAPLEIVADDGSLFQFVTGTIEVNSDGTTNYDFEGYMAIVSGGGNILALTVDWTGANVALGTLTPSTIDANAPGTYNLTKVSRSDNNAGGLFLSAFGADATEGNRSIRLYGSYLKFPVPVEE